MGKFNFEKNLAHQSQAVKAIINVFDGVEIVKPQGIGKENINPFFNKGLNKKIVKNIESCQEENSIEKNATFKSNIVDIMMETGTGKTYTYTKTIFELNKQYGIFKFIIVVPTIPIKAGTIDFLKSESSREHFKEQYGKTIKLHIVERKKTTKNKKMYMPPSIIDFVGAGNFEKDKIQVLIINAGMINSKTMQEEFDRTFLDKHTVPFEALAVTKPLMIIDEPHKFSTKSKTWENIKKINPQFIIRYGATFKENENLVYNLTAVDSFNKNLVKGVIGHVAESKGVKNILLEFVDSDCKEGRFKLIESGRNKIFKITKKESLERVHNAMSGLYIEKLNKSTALLSNGLELKKGDKINPYSYSETLQEYMIRKAIESHFKNEKKYLKRKVKIKPLTLFFIDNIDEYRNKEGNIRKVVEKYIKAEVEKILKTEKDGFYKNYLESTLKDISKTHGGYFSKDNSDKDEKIEKEVNEILHDKQAILNLNNPRRFIFSKWTLREGWDNPNIFQICKLRSSGSDISKLQEVGRGLRLPVNQYGNRVKDEEFFLNYFVDFTENDFIEKLACEINKKSGAISREEIPTKLYDNMINQIVEKYYVSVESLLEKLDEENVIKRSNVFKENGFNYIKKNYPLIFNGIGSNKVRKATDKKIKIKIRTEKYLELKELWEKLNEKVILEYKISSEKEFKELFVEFLKKNTSFSKERVEERIKKIKIENDKAIISEETSISKTDIEYICTMKYDEFLKELSKKININLKTVHSSFVEANVEINSYLNQSTIRLLKQKFDNYLMYNAINKFGIGYQKITNSIHPTKFTNDNGEVLNEISSSDIGVSYADCKVVNNYFLNELFYDSELEKNNIETNVEEVIIFTKIPKNSIKIPVAGGKSYSPDFAYVLNYKDGNKKLYFIVETKNAEEESLREEEKQKIRHAEKFFGDAVKIKFKTQFSNKKIQELLQEIY